MEWTEEQREDVARQFSNDAGNAARQTARVLDQFGVEAEWFHMADPRESILPDGFDAAVAKGMCE